MAHDQDVAERILRRDLRRRNGSLDNRRALHAIAALEPAAVIDRRGPVSAWKNLFGGLPGACSQFLLRTSDGKILELPSKGTRRLEYGDVVPCITAGGGGYGEVRTHRLDVSTAAPMPPRCNGVPNSLCERTAISPVAASIAEEMPVTLVRTSRPTNIEDRREASCALCRQRSRAPAA